MRRISPKRDAPRFVLTVECVEGDLDGMEMVAVGRASDDGAALTSWEGVNPGWKVRAVRKVADQTADG